MRKQRPWVELMFKWLLVVGVGTIGTAGAVWLGLRIWGFFSSNPPLNPPSPPSELDLDEPNDPATIDSTSVLEGGVSATAETSLEDTAKEEGFTVAVLDRQQQKELFDSGNLRIGSGEEEFRDGGHE